MCWADIYLFSIRYSEIGHGIDYFAPILFIVNTLQYHHLMSSDIDECAENLDNCTREVQSCVNTVGSFRCADRELDCILGLRYDPITQQCQGNLRFKLCVLCMYISALCPE